MVPLIGRRPRDRYRRPALRLELLEDRSVPAGVVNATFAAGVLTITAVDDPTDVNITDKNHQNITLDGGGANNITVIANDAETGTAITGSPFNGVTSVKLVMGLGNDTVTITDTVLAGGVTYLGGSGNNQIQIDGAGNFSGLAGGSPGNVTIASLNVTNGDGDDATELGGGTHQVNGSVTVTNGLGNGIVRFGVNAGDVSTVGGAVRITNLDGFDTIEANGATATFTGPITISNGNGGSTIDLGATTTTLTGGITVTNGDGNDDFITGGSTFTVGTPTAKKNITINNGTGAGSNDQNFNATDNIINGNISVTGSVGDDDFSVNGSNFIVLGSVKVSTGNGGGTTSISPTGGVAISGAVTVVAGEGNDQLDFDGNSTIQIGSVSFTSGNGQSTLDFNGTSTTTIAGNVIHTHLAGTSITTFDADDIEINGAITSTHGDGNDTFDLGGTNFTSGVITIRNGNGTGTTRIDASAGSNILGNINITNGDGSDTFQTGGSGFELGTLTARRNLTIRNGNGGSSTVFNATTNTIHGNIAVTNGTAFDEFDVSGNVFDVTGAGNVTISNGVGESDTFIDAATSNSIGGKLTITASDGDDAVTLLRSTMAGAISINTGNGDDSVTINNSIFNGLLALTLGTGSDVVEIENGDINDGVSTVFNASVNINVGNGDDEVLIGVIGDANDFGDFNAAVTITGGLDLDIIQGLANAANTFAIPLIATGFEQGT